MGKKKLFPRKGKVKEKTQKKHGPANQKPNAVQIGGSLRAGPFPCVLNRLIIADVLLCVKLARRPLRRAALCATL